MGFIQKSESEKKIDSVRSRKRIEKKLEKDEQIKYDIENETGEGFIYNIRHRLRLIVISGNFEYLMAGFIIANSIIYSISDYSRVDSNGALLTKGSLSNKAVDVCEPIFLAIFSIEMLMKMTAFGLSCGGMGYFNDGWNWLDFIGVLIGYISLLPGIPNLNVIRTLRCFRTLKALRSFPALKSVTSQVVSSIPSLGETISIYLCSIIFFSIVGLYIFVGPYLHARCRYTPYPVTLDFQIGWSNYSSYRCLDVPNFNLPTDVPQWDKSSSPWAKPVNNCWWPIDNTEWLHRNCALTDDKATLDANNFCIHDNYDIPVEDWRWCGSNYDAYGNYRFTDKKLALAEYNFIDLYYGHATFDNMFNSFVTTFIVSTANNWSTVMQSCTDSITQYATLFFIIVIVVSNFMMLSLMVATWETAVSIDDGALEIPNYFEFSVRGISIEEAQALKANEESTEKDDKHVHGNSQIDLFSDAGSVVIYNGHSSTHLETFSSTDIANHIASLGPLYIPYRKLMIHNDVDGILLHRLNEVETLELLTEIGITKSLHQKKILAEFLKLAAEAPGSPKKIPKEKVKEEDEELPPPNTIWSNPNLTFYQKVLKWHYPPAKRLLSNFWFEMLITLSCLGNLLCSISDSYPENENRSQRIIEANFVIVMFFFFEMVLKVFAYGVGRFMNDPFLVVDSFIVLMSVADALYFVPVNFCLLGKCITRHQDKQPENASTSQVSPLRGLRCVRLIFLLRYLPEVRILVSRIARSVQSTIVFFALIAIFLYMMALVGTSLYANRFRFDTNGFPITAINSYEWIHSNDRPRNNFDYFLRSCATVLQILTLDNWTDIMNSVWRSQGPQHVLYPIITIIIGCYMLLSLFIGKMVEDFTNTADNMEKEMNEFDAKIPPPAGAEIVIQAGAAFARDIEEGKPIERKVDEQPKPYYIPYFSELVINPRFETTIYVAVGISILSVALDSPLANPTSSAARTINLLGNIMTLFFIVEAVIKIIGLGAKVYFTDIWNLFDFMTCASSVYGMFSNNSGVQALRSLRVIKAIRALRLLTSLKGLRVVIDSLSSSTNEIINVSIFLILVWTIFASIAIQYLKGQLRSCQGEPMAFISKNETYMTLLQYPKVWDKFGPEEKEMFGPNSEIWNSVNNYTTNSNLWPDFPLCHTDQAFNLFPMRKVIPTSRQLCECWGGNWLLITGMNFDNIIEALVVAFGLATQEGWYDTMNLVTDTNGIDMQPIFDNSRIWILAFIIFMVFGSFLPLNMYVGVICSAYTKNVTQMYENAEKNKTPEEKEEEKRKFSLSILKKNVELHDKEVEAKVMNYFSSSTSFRTFFTTMIMCNTVVIACDWFGMTDITRQSTKAINAGFSFVFSMEVFFRIRDHGWKFFHSRSNIIDFLIVVLSDVSDALSYSADVDFAILKLGRLFRIIKILKLLKFDSVLRILRILIKIVPGFLNVMFLLVCFVIIYGIIGNQTFALIEFNGTHDKYSNFRTLRSSILSMVKFLTGEGWVQFMYDISVKKPGCVDYPQYDDNMCGFNDKPGCIPINGCGSRGIFPFLMTFQVFAVFTMLNVTISVIVNAFHHEFIQKTIKTNKEYQLFSKGWLLYDPELTCYMKPEVLEQFVMDQENNPFAFPPDLTLRQVRDRLSHLGIALVPGKGCLFENVLLALKLDVDLFEDRSQPIHIQDSLSDPNKLGLLQLYNLKNVRVELIESRGSRKYTKQRRLEVGFSYELFTKFFDKFYTSRAFLFWKHGDRFFNNRKVAGLWPKQLLDNQLKSFEPLDLFTAKLYDELLFKGWGGREEPRKPMSLDLQDPEYDPEHTVYWSYDTPMMKNNCNATFDNNPDTNLLSYINIFNSTGERHEIEESNNSNSPRTPNTVVASRRGIKPATDSGPPPSSQKSSRSLKK